MDKQKVKELYCKWCPHDCKDLTKEEMMGCVACSGFADDLSLFQPKPDESRLLGHEEMCAEIWDLGFGLGGMEGRVPTQKERFERIAQAQDAKTASIKDAEFAERNRLEGGIKP